MNHCPVDNLSRNGHVYHTYSTETGVSVWLDVRRALAFSQQTEYRMVSTRLVESLEQKTLDLTETQVTEYDLEVYAETSQVATEKREESAR
jgi:hypothetical protein